jgi:hypothetical protein
VMNALNSACACYFTLTGLLLIPIRALRTLPADVKVTPRERSCAGDALRPKHKVAVASAATARAPIVKFPLRLSRAQNAALPCARNQSPLVGGPACGVRQSITMLASCLLSKQLSLNLPITGPRLWLIDRSDRQCTLPDEVFVFALASPICWRPQHRYVPWPSLLIYLVC